MVFIEANTISTTNIGVIYDQSRSREICFGTKRILNQITENRTLEYFDFDLFRTIPHRLE